MDWNGIEYIVRYTRLREESKPVEIYPANTLEPIRANWVAITYGIIWSEHRPEGLEAFNFCFLTDEGRVLASEQFETLEIALDQANAIAGIQNEEWKACRIEVTEGNGSIPWSHVS